MTEKAFDIEAFVEQVALAIDLPLPPEYKQGVVDNFARTAAIAQIVLEFPLPQDLEVAPIFQPAVESQPIEP